MSFSRCPQAQDGGAIQIRVTKIVKIGEVMCINCSQISRTGRSVWARTWILVAVLFR
jgi:hypothetical protein